MEIHQATQSDIPVILDVWNPIIRDREITFNSVEKTVDMMAGELAEKSTKGLPFLLAIEGGTLLGFATFGQFRASNGYRKTAEHTIILARDARGRGVGRTLLEEIENHASKRGFHSMIAGICSTNESAVSFHTACGYQRVGHLCEVGFKFDKWYDLVLMQKML